MNRGSEPNSPVVRLSLSKRRGGISDGVARTATLRANMLSARRLVLCWKKSLELGLAKAPPERIVAGKFG